MVYCRYVQSWTRLSCPRKKGFGTSRVVDSIRQERRASHSVSIRCNRKKRWSVLIPPTSRGVEGRKCPYPDQNHFGLGISPSSIIQSDLSFSPSWLSHLECNDGHVSVYDTDLDICSISSSPTSDAFDEGAPLLPPWQPVGNPSWRERP